MAGWLTYVSNESGRNEIYLRPFPGSGRRLQISSERRYTQAIWNPNGKEIFYRIGDKMMVVEISTTPDVTLSPPRLLFEHDMRLVPASPSPTSMCRAMGSASSWSRANRPQPV